MLEGETQIPPPPYLFQVSMPKLVLSSGDSNDEDSDPSKSTRNKASSEPSYATPGEGALEIEILIS